MYYSNPVATAVWFAKDKPKRYPRPVALRIAFADKAQPKMVEPDLTSGKEVITAPVT